MTIAIDTAARPGATTAAPGARRLWLRFWPLLPAIGFLAAIFFYPVLQILWLSIVGAGGKVSGEHYEKLFSSTLYLRALLITLKISGWTTVIVLIGGYPLAYLLANTTDKARGILLVGVLMPFWTSFLVKTFAWMVILGSRGVVNGLLQSAGITEEPVKLMFNLTGVLVGLSHALMPLAVLTMFSVMQNIDGNLMRAAATLGGRRGQAFWRVYFPLSFPGVAAAGLIVFITSMGWFVTPMLLGGDREIMLSQLIIFNIENILNWNFAAALAVFLLGATIAVYLVYDRVVGLSTLEGAQRDATPGKTVGRLGQLFGMKLLALLGHASALAGAAYDRLFHRNADRPRRSFSGLTLWIAALLGLAFLLLPTFFVIPISVSNSSFIAWPPRGFTFRWYETVVQAPVWRGAALRSLLVGFTSASIAMLIAVPAAFVLTRQRIPAKTAIMAFILSPMILPHIIVALALYYFYAQVGLVGTSLALILAHTAFSIPVVIVTIMAALRNYDIRLDHAAWSLGADKLTTMRRITFPIIRAAMLAAFLFAFVKSFDELSVAMFVSGSRAPTLPKQMWTDAVAQVSPALTAVSTILLVFVTGAILAAEWLNRRARR